VACWVNGQGVLAVPQRAGQQQQLQPQAFVPLGVGSITPQGWLLEQLKLQAEGLSGHLAMFYPSIAESWWVGGTQDQGSFIYQQAPYWSVSSARALP
jgi:hypothetical protein